MKGVDVVLLSSGRLLQELSPRVNVALLSLPILTSADVLLRVFQAWSPTQFYLFVFFHNPGLCVKSVVSEKAQSKFASAVFDGVLGTPCRAQHDTP